MRSGIWCGNVNWLLNLNLIYETLGWGKEWLVDFDAGKTQLVLFDWSNNTGCLDVKMDESVLKEKPSFKMLVLTFSSKLDWDSYIISVADTAFNKIGALIHYFSWGCSVSLSTIYSCTIVAFRLVPLVATWNC